MISWDVTLDKTASLTNGLREDAIAQSDCSSKEQIELEFDARIQSSSVDERQDVAFKQQKTYGIAMSREKRQTRPPQRYTNLVVYDLPVIGSLDLQKRAISLKADRWSGTKGDRVEAHLDGTLSYLLLSMKDIPQKLRFSEEAVM